MIESEAKGEQLIELSQESNQLEFIVNSDGTIRQWIANGKPVEPIPKNKCLRYRYDNERDSQPELTANEYENALKDLEEVERGMYEIETPVEEVRAVTVDDLMLLSFVHDYKYFERNDGYVLCRWHAYMRSIEKCIEKSMNSDNNCESEPLESRNRAKNMGYHRYGDQLKTSDFCDVVLSMLARNYISVRHICYPELHRRDYIMPVRPTKRTVGNFWLMIWEQKVTQIVDVDIASDLSDYLRDFMSLFDVRKLLELNLMVSLFTGEENTIEFNAHYIKHSFLLKNHLNGESRRIINLKMMKTGGNAPTLETFVRCLREIRDTNRHLSKQECGPIAVLCNGTTRSAKLAFINTCLDEIEATSVHNICIPKEIETFRKQTNANIFKSASLRTSIAVIVRYLEQTEEKTKTEADVRQTKVGKQSEDQSEGTESGGADTSAQEKGKTDDRERQTRVVERSEGQNEFTESGDQNVSASEKQKWNLMKKCANKVRQTFRNLVKSDGSKDKTKDTESGDQHVSER